MKLFSSYKFKGLIRLFLIAIPVLLLCITMGFAAEHTFPDAIIELPENENAIIVEKKTQTLFLYTFKDSDSDLLVDFMTSCSTGENEGVKQKAGDKKTPKKSAKCGTGKCS